MVYIDKLILHTDLRIAMTGVYFFLDPSVLGLILYRHLTKPSLVDRTASTATGR